MLAAPRKVKMSSLKSILKTVQEKINPPKERNSITVDDVSMDFPLVFDGNGKMYFFKLDRYVYVKGTRYTKLDKKSRPFLLTCRFRRGFMSDGASAPEFAKMFVPDVKKGDDVYNAAPFIHDGLYMYQGNINGLNMTREECDDILRGIWRIADMSRVVAGAADVGVHVFAGSPTHWGNDSNNCKHLFEAKFEYR